MNYAGEKGEYRPTFKQLDTLSGLYKVPRWVFIAESLPKEHQFEKSVPSFRQFMNNDKGIFENHKVRGLVTKTEEFRELIIQLREDLGEDITPFNPPKINQSSTPLNAAKQIRK